MHSHRGWKILEQSSLEFSDYVKSSKSLTQEETHVLKIMLLQYQNEFKELVRGKYKESRGKCN